MNSSPVECGTIGNEPAVDAVAGGDAGAGMGCPRSGFTIAIPRHPRIMIRRSGKKGRGDPSPGWVRGIGLAWQRGERVFMIKVREWVYRPKSNLSAGSSRLTCGRAAGRTKRRPVAGSFRAGVDAAGGKIPAFKSWFRWVDIRRGCGA